MSSARQISARRRTAAADYTENLIECHGLVEKLIEKIGKHQERAEADPKNWGYNGDNGDMVRAISLLTEAIEAL